MNEANQEQQEATSTEVEQTPVDTTLVADEGKGDVPVDPMETVVSISKRADELLEWFKAIGAERADQAIEAILKEKNHPNPSFWRPYLVEDIADESVDDAVRLVAVRHALHLALTTYSEDTTHIMMSMNSQSNPHLWFALFERHIADELVRLAG